MRKLFFAVLALGASAAWAQQVISAHSGVIHKVEGQVLLDGQQVHQKFGEFPDMKNGQTLLTEDGRAEVLLTPGVILRIAESSSFKMVSNIRSDTRLEMLTGSSLIEVGELLPSNAITLIFHDVHIDLTKKGLYRVDANEARLRVYDGEARVTQDAQTITAHKGREVLMGPVLSANNFNTKDTDAFFRWASRRSESLSVANVSAARSASSLGYYGSSGYGSYGYGLGSWLYNPWFGMFTYLPYGNSIYYSPFGWYYYSPVTIVYYQPTYYYGGGGGSTGGGQLGANPTHRDLSGGGASVSPRNSGLVSFPNGPSHSGGYSGPVGGVGSGPSAAPSSSGGGFSGGGMVSAGGHAGGGGGAAGVGRAK